jgi:membrane protease YdiL (CAAX protease family)
MMWPLERVPLMLTWEPWVQHWWQLVMAINPGIAEEAWGRILLIPMIFILFKQVFRPRQAYLLAMIIGTYWFAFLHTGGGVQGLISTLMTGTLFVLPITFICLHRNLETAIGFHFFIDFIKFLAAFFLNVGLRPG